MGRAAVYATSPHDMEILFVATELSPMVKVGGLADVVTALPKALRQLGHNVTVCLPRYAEVERSGLMLARRLTPLTLPGSDGKTIEVTVFDGRLGSGVELMLLEPMLDGTSVFADRGIYGDEDGKDYEDNDRRFGLFAQAAVEVMRQRVRSGNPFSVVHLHDWPTAMVAYLLKQDPELRDTRSVLTIHNLAHQGIFPAESLKWLGLSSEHFHPDALEFYGKANFLKGGIVSADVLSTVSPTYAREIQTPEEGNKLDGVLGTRADRLVGILNGIDYAVWNPTTDPAVIARYDAEDPGNKGRCKSAFCQEVGLDIAPERPLIVSLGRLSTQKGTDVLAKSLAKILRADVSIAIAGGGDPKLAKSLMTATKKAPGQAVFLEEVPEPLAHRMIAAADIVLMPSRYEPCGLVQQYAQRYGAIPVAARTGGLIDTIVDVDAELVTGTGFLFDKVTQLALVGAIGRALSAYQKPEWARLCRRVMRLDLGWDRPARRYAQVYRDGAGMPIKRQAADDPAPSPAP